MRQELAKGTKAAYFCGGDEVTVDGLLVGSDAMMALIPYHAVASEKAKVEKLNTCRKTLLRPSAFTRVEGKSIVVSRAYLTYSPTRQEQLQLAHAIGFLIY